MSQQKALNLQNTQMESLDDTSQGGVQGKSSLRMAAFCLVLVPSLVQGQLQLKCVAADLEWPKVFIFLLGEAYWRIQI